VQHVREGIPLHPRETGIQLVLEVRGRDHERNLLQAINAHGIQLTMQR
jgi:hypothetical protein